MKRKPTNARNALKAPPFAQAVIKPADLKAYDLTALMQFYWTLRHCIDALSKLTDSAAHAAPMFTLVDRRFVSPLDHALDACQAAIKAAKPKDGRPTELRAALLYDHALQFDGSDEERRAILASAMLAIPPDVKSEVLRFRKTKFGEGGELHTIKDKDGKHIIWRHWTPASKLRELRSQAQQKRKAAKA
jgi:hypothetical protein